MYFEDTEYFVFLLPFYGSELGLLLQREHPHHHPELKAKTPWKITVGVCLQYNRDREFGWANYSCCPKVKLFKTDRCDAQKTKPSDFRDMD